MTITCPECGNEDLVVVEISETLGESQPGKVTFDAEGNLVPPSEYVFTPGDVVDRFVLCRQDNHQWTPRPSGAWRDVTRRHPRAVKEPEPEPEPEPKKPTKRHRRVIVWDQGDIGTAPDGSRYDLHSEIVRGEPRMWWAEVLDIAGFSRKGPAEFMRDGEWPTKDRAKQSAEAHYRAKISRESS